jgi:N-acetylglucosaminyl-diphospho-decaprenol L-rhamnosyltransferase
MDLTIIIVSYNTCDLLRRCLQSLRDHPATGETEIIVVDNASADDSVAMVRAEFADVRLRSQSHNLGYAAANNLALRDLRARYGLILNSDIEVHAGALDALLAFMDIHPEAGLAGARLILPDGSVQDTWQHGFTLGEFVRQQLYLDRLVPRTKSRETREGEQPREVAHLHGACLMVRREALQQVGLLDEGYFMYCEDSDWCRRFRQAGWQLSYVPAAEMLHHHGASSRQIRGDMIAAYNLAAARYFRRHRGRLAGLAARLAGLLGMTLRLLGAGLLAGLTAGRSASLRQKARVFARAWWLQVRPGGLRRKPPDYSR